MARFDTSGLDKIIKEMERLGELSGSCALAMCNAAAAEIRDAWKESAEEHELRDTGAMIESIGFPAPPTQIGSVVYQDIYPQGKDAKGTRNAEKAFILHYGTSKIPATYWVDDADEKSEPRVTERLNAIWAEYLATGKVPVVVE